MLTRSLLCTRGFSSFSNFSKETRKVICIGRNYVDHIKELGNTQGKEPFFFLKPPSSILAPDEGPVQLPRGIHSHYEVELGLVMGRTVRDLDKEDLAGAQASIAGYFCAIDMTGRNMQEACKRKGLPWTTPKGFDTYLPVSRFIDAAQITDPARVLLELKVNGEVKQRDSTELMIYNIPKILAHISSIMTLEKGDIVLTGTPKGVGKVVAGDVMACRMVDEVTGRDIAGAEIQVECMDRDGGYIFME
ncbi:fumarylacetoacetate hydrolase family protein [Protomyces lactucae-debilis]|uniref:Fumarylacetoacetate hydrolase family protein n=1 Tax=Protomyces lactucae-debilis TaxID=2754530 RepID=A0A1Y2EVB9_PROLT|nr:fumarylacetoacetate hydrolase family protein [Protomyces lactucae-debilis]ORY75457.1 fumarylacetoacetate hydrolase family protein [Protomyces lactucae-debilis]